MTDRRPAISVIIPTFQRRDRVLALLNALTRQDLSADEFEVIVAVDGSTDGTGEAVAGAKWPFELRVREQPNRGPAAARNLGARESRAPILALLDDDMEPVPEFLREHLAIQRRSLGCITIGPVPIDTGPRATPLQRYRAFTFASRYDRLRRPGARPTVTDGCLGNCTVTREQFLEAGGFDESFRRYGLEDFDLVRRLVDRGVEMVFVSGAIAHQTYDKSLEQLARNTQDEGHNSVHLARKHPDLLQTLDLGQWRERSRRHRAALTLFLRYSRPASVAWRAVMSATESLLRVEPPFLRRWLDFVFEAHYWIGVCEAPTGPGEAFRKGASMSRALSDCGLSPEANPTQRRNASTSR